MTIEETDIYPSKEHLGAPIFVNALRSPFIEDSQGGLQRCRPRHAAPIPAEADCLNRSQTLRPVVFFNRRAAGHLGLGLRVRLVDRAGAPSAVQIDFGNLEDALARPVPFALLAPARKVGDRHGTPYRSHPSSRPRAVVPSRGRIRLKPKHRLTVVRVTIPSTDR